MIDRDLVAVTAFRSNSRPAVLARHRYYSLPNAARHHIPFRSGF
jgi:hypothetical protein